MTTTDGRHRLRRRVPGTLAALLFQVLVLAGVLLLVYPQAADWFAGFGHRAQIAAYVQSVTKLPAPGRSAALEAAQQYNARIAPGTLQDPFTTSDSAQVKTADYQAYLNLLNPGGDGIMGWLTYPAVHINLPIYHGTSEQVMANGIGHLYGSSLPVGGLSTHAVLTSHSGLIDAKLFTGLVGGASLGDTFHISTLGQTLYYRVDRIQTVLPTQTQSLGITPGKDYVTLVTCTPIGVNSHRLLVRGVRIAAPPQAAPAGPQALLGAPASAGFPWWALWIAVALTATTYLYVPMRKRGKRKGSTS